MKQVVDEATGTEDPGDQLRFELGGSDLSGSVSETDYNTGGCMDSGNDRNGRFRSKWD